jgi:hypothetical protein
MSAQLDGNATGTDAPAGSVASTASETTSQVATPGYSDIWAEIAKPEESKPETVTDSAAQPAQAEATPKPEPDSRTAVEGEEKPQASQDEDKFAKVTTPTRDDWQELRAHKGTLETKLREVEPIAQKVAEVGGPRVLDFVAPIFQKHETPLDAVKNIYAGFDGLVKGDPTVKPHVMEAAYLLDPEQMWNWAAKDKGLDKQWPEFQQWKQAGSPGPDDAPFPQPDPTTSYVRLPDGTELYLKYQNEAGDMLDDPVAQRIYNLEKGQYERGVADKKAEREKQVATQQETERQAAEQVKAQQAEADKRVQDFTTARAAVLDSALKQLKFDAGSEKETALARLMTLGLFEATMRQNGDFLKASERGHGLAAAGGTLAEDVGNDIDNLAVSTLASLHETVMSMFSELHTLRQQVGGLSPQPRKADPGLPAEIADVEPPPSNGQLPADPYAQIWNQLG